MGKSDFMLSAHERLQRQRKRRRIIIIVAAGLISIGIAVAVARPIRKAVRGWQSRRHASHALTLIEQEKWREARDEASAAYQLKSTEPAALRAIALLLSRAGQVDALEFWRNLASVAPLTPNDLREQAKVALKANDLAAAGDAIHYLLDNPKEKPTAGDWLLAADVWGRKREYDKAVQMAEKALAEPNATRRDQFQALLILETIMHEGSAGLVKDAQQVNSKFAEFAKGNDDVALDALVGLAQNALTFRNGPDAVEAMPSEEVIRRINEHPLAKTLHKLLAADLEIARQPDQRSEIEEREINRLKKSNDEDLAALGTWLYQHSEFQKILDTIPLERAVLARELFLQHVNTLGALGRWDEIRKLLESERYPLDPVIQHMYLARCYAQQGQDLGAENNWQRAIQSAAGDVTHLLMVGDYAEKNSNLKIARTAYDAAAAVSPRLRAAQLGRLRIAQASGDTKQIHATLEELLKIWPHDTALQNDEAYTRLLLLPRDTKADDPELKAIEAIARKLVEQEPSSLPHRTVLGLVLLKENQAYSALGVYAGLNVPQKELTPSAVVVHSAVLAATGRDEDAHTEISHLPQNKMLPEERALINSL